MYDPWGLTAVLPWLIAALVGYYVARVAVALLLLRVGRGRPRLQLAALRCAPAALRPVLRRTVAGGLLGVALTGGTALAAGTPCPVPGGSVPVLDRAAVSCPAATAAPAPAPAEAPTPPAGTTPPQQPPADSTTAGASPTSAEPASTTYTVRAGDSLWEITAERLGRGASDADIAAAWPQLWNANRTAVGDDPNRIMPGTVLVLTDQLMEGTN